MTPQIERALRNAKHVAEQAPMIERRHIQIDSTWIHYKIAGAGAPLILVHGLAGSTRWWHRNMIQLAAHFRVYAVDLSEFGDRRFRPRFVLSQAAYYLGRWMQALDITQASLIGHSMGGRIAAEFSAEHPTQVDRLVLVSAAILPFRHGYTKQLWGMLRAFRRIPLSLLQVLLFDTFYTGLVPVLRVGHELLKGNLEHKLAHIQSPTLVIWGEHDTIVPVGLGQTLNQRLLGSQFVLIKGAGHVPMWEKPAEFNRLALAFLLA